MSAVSSFKQVLHFLRLYLACMVYFTSRTLCLRSVLKDQAHYYYYNRLSSWKRLAAQTVCVKWVLYLVTLITVQHRGLHVDSHYYPVKVCQALYFNIYSLL